MQVAYDLTGPVGICFVAVRVRNMYEKKKTPKPRVKNTIRFSIQIYFY